MTPEQGYAEGAAAEKREGSIKASKAYQAGIEVGTIEGAAAERERVLKRLYLVTPLCDTLIEKFDCQSQLGFNAMLIKKEIQALRSQPERQNDVVNFSLMPVPESHAFKRVNPKTEPECGACTGPDPLDVLEQFIHNCRWKIWCEKHNPMKKCDGVYQRGKCDFFECPTMGSISEKIAELRKRGQP